MKELINHKPSDQIPDATQLDMNFHSDTKNDDVTHLGPDDLIKMQVDEPEEYEAFMTEIERQRKLIEQEKELEKIERLAIEAEEKEIAEKRKDELRASIVKACEEDEEKKENDNTYDLYTKYKNIAGEIHNNNSDAKGFLKKKKRKWW